MRKILSIILTAAMTLSLFAAIPIGASAEELQAKTATNKSYEFSNFESPAEAAYHSKSNNKSVVSIEKADDSQNNAAKFTRFVSLNNNNAWQSSLRISQTDSEGNVSSFKVKPGASYDLTFKMKIDWANSQFTSIDSILVFYVGDYNGSYFNSGSALNDWSAKTNFWHGIGSGDCSDWTDKHFSFTVPSNLSYVDEVVIVPVISDWENSGVLWMDDIAIAENQMLETNVDFEDYDFFYNKSNNLGQGATIADTGDNAYGKALKFTTINQADGNDWSGMWPQCAKISSVNKVGAFRVNHERKYEISFDIKKVTADANFDLYAHFNAVSSNVDKIGYRDFTGQWSPKKVKIATFDPGASDWTHVTVELTVSPKATGGQDYSELTFVPYRNDGSGDNYSNQEIYIDNVSVKALTKITTHNLAVDGQVVYAAANADISTVQASMPGAKVKNWYTDSSLTTLAEGKVGTAERELWATLETVTGDFENGNNLAVDGWGGDTYQLKQYAGTVNSYAITDYKEGGTPSNSDVWPPVLQLLNPDGTPFLTYKDHEYIVKFDMKVDNPSLVPDRATLALLHNKPPYTGGDFSSIYKTIDDTPAKINFKYSYRNSDESYGTSGWYVNFTFNFKGHDNGFPVYVTPWQAMTFTYFDNFQIIDVTAQKVISDANGKEIARGYAGETVTIPDAADPNFVYYQDENGTPVGTTTVVRQGKVLTKVNSQIAVTESVFDKDKSTISFKTRFGGIGYTKANGGVTVNTITVGNTRYFVEDMGLLVAPTANVTGELTLDNLCGATKISGTSLKYSANGTEELQVTAQIATSKYDRDYTVVGYVKCAGGKVIYSKTRSSIAKSYNAAAGIESVEDVAHTVTLDKGAKYTLVSNSEFNSAESLSNGWNPWGAVNNPNLTDKKKPDCNYYSVESATYVDNGNLVLDLKRTGNNTYDLPELLSKYHFTTGYLEVKAKFANPSDFSCSIWLNSVAVPGEDLKYKPNDNDIYVWPEIDIMESFAPGSFSLTLHNWGTPSGGKFGQRDQIRLNDKNTDADHTPLDLTKYHTYGLERTPQVIRMYVDGKLYYELTYAGALATYNTNKKPSDYQYRTVNEIKALFENPTYLILGTGDAQSLAVDASAKSTIDYVRFYK